MDRTRYLTRLAVLGLLKSEPQHGYELKRTIQERMEGWASINFGSIYFALRQMEREGLIVRERDERRGKRPVRSIYRITAAGTVAFRSLLRRAWQEVERYTFAVDLGVAFMGDLDRKEVHAFLAQRVETLGTLVAKVESHRSERLANPAVPKVASAIFEHVLAHMRAELEWSKTVRKKVASRILP